MYQRIGKVQNIVMLAVLCFRSAWVPQATNVYLRVTGKTYIFHIQLYCKFKCWAPTVHDE